MSHMHESSFSVGVQAWHGLANVVQLEDVVTVEQAIVEAGLDWDVAEAPVYAEMPNPVGDTGEIVPVPTHKAIVRVNDDLSKVPLGIVSSTYKPLTNREAFSWFDPLLQDDTVRFETAGSLSEGRKVWILARYADNVEIKPGDDFVPYLLLATGHDGKMSIQIKNTPVRVVCWNTMQAAGVKSDRNLTEEDRQSQITIKHKGDLDAKLTAARDAVELARMGLASTVNVYRAMASKPVDVQTATNFAKEVFDPDYVKARDLVAKLETRIKQEDGELKKALKEKMDELHELMNKSSLMERKVIESFESGPGHELAGSTVYGLFNAATHYIDHQRSNSVESSLKASWFGQGAGLRSRAYDYSLGLLK